MVYTYIVIGPVHSDTHSTPSDDIENFALSKVFVFSILMFVLIYIVVYLFTLTHNTPLFLHYNYIVQVTLILA